MCPMCKKRERSVLTVFKCHTMSNVIIILPCFCKIDTIYSLSYPFVRQSWRDGFLIWNPEDFNGTDVVRLPASMLWKPDIVLYQR